MVEKEENSVESEMSGSEESDDPEEAIAERTAQLQENPYSFALYVELIRLHRK